MLIEIKHKHDGAIIWLGEAESLKVGLEMAVSTGADLSAANLSGASLSGANLTRANLSGANLSGANLSGANLSGADLREADLSGADLREADLREADLREADLREADLFRANLSGAYLREADLSGANLSGANLRGANLSGANLSGANLAPIRDDLWAVLSGSPREAVALREAIASGKISGSAYAGECACLVGTLANAAGCSYNELPNIRPDARRPAEKFFLAINAGDTPETNEFARLALEWTDQFITNMRSAFGQHNDTATTAQGT